MQTLCSKCIHSPLEQSFLIRGCLSNIRLQTHQYMPLNFRRMIRADVADFDASAYYFSRRGRMSSPARYIIIIVRNFVVFGGFSILLDSGA